MTKTIWARSYFIFNNSDIWIVILERLLQFQWRILTLTNSYWSYVNLSNLNFNQCCKFNNIDWLFQHSWSIPDFDWNALNWIPNLSSIGRLQIWLKPRNPGYKFPLLNRKFDSLWYSSKHLIWRRLQNLFWRFWGVSQHGWISLIYFKTSFKLNFGCTSNSLRTQQLPKL